MSGRLQLRDDDGDDGRCQECGNALAVGPCAACEAMICSDCGVLSRDPSGQRVICLSCARLIADVDSRPRRRRPPLLPLIAGALLIGFALALLHALLGCGSERPAPAAPPPPPPPADAAPADAAPPDAGPPPPVRMTRTVEPPGGPGGLAGTPVVTARVYVFADTQLHYLFGKRTFAQSPFADRFSFEVAVRPAALDDGSDLLLDLFVTEHQRFFPDHTLVFLGDASDLSCTQELDRFLSLLESDGIDSLLSVASNHDGFYVGNFTSTRDHDGELVVTDMPNDWTRACSEPDRFDDHRLTKGRAVARLAAALPPGPPWATSTAHLNAEGPQDYPNSYLYYVRPLGGGDPGAPPAWGVFLDTVDYRDFDLPASTGAGRNGAVSRQQLRFLDRAMFEAKAASTRPASFLLFGHHPIDELEPHSRRRLIEFLDVRPEIAGYISAHTHISMERSIALPGGRTVPEIVVGSTTDTPQAARLLSLELGADGARGVASWRLVLAPDLCADVPPMAATTVGYTGYRILRDGTPDVSVSAFEKLRVFFGATLAAKRIVQALGALVVENELVRAWAHLYLGSPLDLKAPTLAELRAIENRRFAAGDNYAAITPWLQGRAHPEQISAYDAWQDPVTARVVRVATLGLHRFGAHHSTFERLRAARTETAAARHYFLCHAVHAADAEARRPRRSGNVLYIR